jgi:hypothetical protein
VRRYVEKKLGTATARLHERIVAMIQMAHDAGASALQAHGALAQLSLRVLCGDFHDYRSGELLPKGDLVEAMRALPAHASIAVSREELITAVLAGGFRDSEDEAKRWVARLVSPRPSLPAQSPPAQGAPRALELSHREYRVFVTLYRYVEVYGNSPQLRELAELASTQGDAGPGDRVRLNSLKVAEVLRQLAAKDVVMHLGGTRGWVPLRAP